MIRVLVAVVLALSACQVFAQQTAEEQAVWKMEHKYWADVKAADLVSYRALWHPNFLGWPGSSAIPARKAHITDWIAAFTSKGTHLSRYTLKPAASQSTGDLVVTDYWMTADWVDKSGTKKRERDRITHTWIRVGSGWQIISGMSCPVPAAGK
ncbi:MAG TPA: nuclear transport factor 2 family protein [Terracidiphilus sp.]|nr:nuclear transport factor 2 family protein [Terracidiphilus sp.]